MVTVSISGWVANLNSIVPAQSISLCWLRLKYHPNLMPSAHTSGFLLAKHASHPETSRRLRLKYRPNLISLAGGMQELPITKPEARAIPTPVSFDLLILGSCSCCPACLHGYHLGSLNKCPANPRPAIPPLPLPCSPPSGSAC